MIPCEYNSMLGRYHDGELTGAQRRQLEHHLGDCPPCSAELEQMQAMSHALRCGAAEIMPRASGEFLARLQSLGSNVESLKIIRFATRLTAAAAAILVAATIQWALHRQPAAPPNPGTATGPILGSDERVVLNPDSASETASTEPELDLISQELSGGRQ